MVLGGFFRISLGFSDYVQSLLRFIMILSPCYYICFPAILHLEDKPKESLNYTRSMQLPVFEMENLSVKVNLMEFF